MISNVAAARYRVRLWDNELGEFGGWSRKLVANFLEKTDGLTWREIGLAIRKLRDSGWDDVSIAVNREPEPCKP